MSAGTPTYEITLKPGGSWFNLDLKSLWQYRDLLMLLVRRDFVAKYRQTILGPLWFIIQPLFMTVVFTVIFGMVAGLSTDGLPPTLFYLCGQLVWSYFSQTFSSTSTTLLSNAGLFGKVYFPRLVVPLAVLVSNLFTFVIQGATFAVFFLYFKFVLHDGSFGLTWQVVFLPLVLLHTALLSLGIGLLMSAATAKYRDLTQLSGLLIQVWMYATPVIFPLGKFPEKWRWLMAFNPMGVVVESFRLMLLGTGTVVPAYWLLSIGFSLVTLVAGLLIFARVEKTFVDIV
jgi:lipopolysaccharide transport system permease protein